MNWKWVIKAFLVHQSYYLLVKVEKQAKIQESIAVTKKISTESMFKTIVIIKTLKKDF